MQRILITGANRGIGLEMVRQYLQADESLVFAACRKPDEAADLKALQTDNLYIIQLDVTDDESIRALALAVAETVEGLDLLVNNAAINPPAASQTLENIDSKGMLSILHTNTVAPLMVTRALRHLLKAGTNPRVVNISSSMGSNQLRTSGGHYGYCSSKAALNMVSRGLAADLGRHNVVTVALDPGWVQTDMGGRNASLTPEKSVSNVMKVIANLKQSDNGSFLGWDGKPRPW